MATCRLDRKLLRRLRATATVTERHGRYLQYVAVYRDGFVAVYNDRPVRPDAEAKRLRQDLEAHG